MNYRILGKTAWSISEIGLGTWQVGGGWGKSFDPKVASQLLHAAFDQGVNFVDTADVYDGGLSEAAVGKAVRERSETIYVATKCGRRLQPHEAAGYTPKNLQKFVEDSLRNTRLERLDLIQLHCPPSSVFDRDEVFGLFEQLIQQGKVAALGVSIEKISEGIRAMDYPVVSSIQVIVNMFRQKPVEELFELAESKNVGLIVRVPLASGLLTGKFNAQTRFEKEDHRFFNREGQAFDKGETFSGVPLELGFAAVEELKTHFAPAHELAAQALRWVLMHRQVSTVIPGASTVAQVMQNIEAGQLPPLSSSQMQEATRIYEQYIKTAVHSQW